MRDCDGAAATVAAEVPLKTAPSDPNACAAWREAAAAAEDVAAPAAPFCCSVEATAVWMTRSRAVPEAVQSAMVAIVLILCLRILCFLNDGAEP